MIRKVDTIGIITTIAGDNIGGYSGDNGPAVLAEINYANSIAIDAEQNVYINDIHNNRIRRINYDTHGALTTKEFYIPSIIIYPNPAHNNITISATAPITDVAITDPIGQIVYRSHYSTTGQVQVSTAGLPDGIYFIKINGSYIRKFIKE